ncbi:MULTISPECIES: tyrosine-type recombinase/integrase [unclassified Streptomyces]|uniref:site-specific integrase n=1 Tax=unclassified Streptomyces TaxID=2593676 RepID=UPI002E2E8678|nr:tyrosine-type recombinase/integrase [Streptomyces sp. NBC_00228]
MEKYPPATFGERRPRVNCIGSWQARYRDPTGKQCSKNYAIKDGGEKAARAFLDDIRTRVRQRTYRDPERGKVTLGTWWEEFWEVEQQRLSITTRIRKLGLWTKYIQPAWADYKLIDLEYMALQKWLSRNVRGWETQKKTKELLVALMDAAIKDGERISVNPAIHLTMTATRPVKHPDDLKPPTAAQYDLIHAALPPYYQRIFRDFAYETAMRPGEVAGARRNFIDEAERVLYVKEILVSDNGRLVRQAVAKTEAGLRAVPLTQTAWEAVQWMIDLWQPARTRSAIGDGRDLHLEELLFRGPRGAALNINNIRRPWRRATIQAGVARMVVNPETGRREWWPRPYEYRHDVTTRLHRKGVPERDAQAFLGQKRGGRVTWTYTHEGEDSRERVRTALTGDAAGFSGLRAVE